MSNLIRLEVLADHFEEIGDYEMAETILKQIVKVSEKHFGQDNEKLTSKWFNLALLAEAQNRRAHAIEYAWKAYNLSRIHEGEHSSTTQEIRQFIRSWTRKKAA